MTSSQVPLWVPLVVALIGLLGVLATQIFGGWREDRRSKREQDREDHRWRRERSQQLEERQFDRKIDAYNAVLTAGGAWGWALHPIAKGVLSGETTLTDEDKRELAALRQLTRDTLGPMSLYASDTVRDATWRAINARGDFTRELAKGTKSLSELDTLWKTSWKRYEEMVEVMRKDVDLSEKRTRPHSFPDAD